MKFLKITIFLITSYYSIINNIYYNIKKTNKKKSFDNRIREFEKKLII